MPDQIPGWFDFQHIYSDAVERAPKDRRSVCVEIGAWLGASTRFMAETILASGKPIDFFTCDTWEGSPSESYQLELVAQHGGSIFPEFCRNVSAVSEAIKPMRMSSLVAHQFFGEQSIDFLFVDGCHDFAHVRNELRLWTPKVKFGGTMGGHDFGWPGMQQAIEERLPISEVRMIGDSWLTERGKGHGGEWKRPLAPRRNDDLPPHILYIPYAASGLDLLANAIASVDSPALRAIVIDDSFDRLSHESIIPRNWGLFRVAEHLRFTQVQNLAQSIAHRAGVPWLLFMHADAEARDSSVVADLLAFAEQNRDYGVVFSMYDSLAVFNMDAVASVGPWDETFNWYVSDCDYYYRMRLAGYKAEEFPGGRDRVFHHGSQSIKCDHRLHSLAKSNDDYERGHYRHKWGGSPGQERYSTPYGY